MRNAGRKPLPTMPIPIDHGRLATPRAAVPGAFIMLRRLALTFVPSMAICSALVCVALFALTHENPETARSGYIVASS